MIERKLLLRIDKIWLLQYVMRDATFALYVLIIDATVIDDILYIYIMQL